MYEVFVLLEDFVGGKVIVMDLKCCIGGYDGFFCGVYIFYGIYY